VLFAVIVALVGLPASAQADLGSLRDLGGLNGCLSSRGATDCRPAQATHGVMEIAFTADGLYAYSTAFYDRKVQALKRNPTTGKLDPINAAPSVDNPHGVAVSPDGKNVYAADGGGVVAFSRDQATGAITNAGYTDGGLKHPRLTTTSMGIDISPDGKFVYAVIRQIHAIAIFSREAQTGVLTRVPGQQGCVSERGRLIPDEPSTANTCVAAPAMLGIIDITIGPGGNQLYTVSDQKDSIAVLTRNATTGLLAPAVGDAKCVAPGGKWYWPDDNNPLLTETSFDCKTANPHSEYLNGISFAPDGGSAYVAGRPGMAAYSRNAATGALTMVAGKDGCTTYYETDDDSCHYSPNAKYARRAWVRPDGKRVYAAIGESAGVMTWDRDAATGGLTPLKREAGCTAMQSYGVRYFHACALTRHLSGAWFAIGSPDGRHIYAGSLWDHEIISFAIVRTTFTPGPIDFFVQEVGQTAAAKTTTVRNDGTVPMPISSVSIGGADASSYAIASNTCTGTLAVNATCTVGVTFTPTKKAYLNATLAIASTGSATSPDSAALAGIGIITQAPPPGLAQLPGDEGCLTFDGREVASDAATAGRCKVAPGIGRLNNGWQSSPDNVLVSPDSKHVYTTSYNPFDAKWNAMVGLSRDASSGGLTSLGCRTRPAIAGCTALGDDELPLNMAISPDGKSLYAGSSLMGGIATGGFASYDRDPATGALTKRPSCFSVTGTAPTCTVVRSLRNLYSIHVAPDGRNVYVVSQKLITTFDRDPVTGDVTKRTGKPSCISPDGDLEATAGNDNLCTAAAGTNIMKRMVFAPGGNHVYVGGAYSPTAGTTDAITLFDRAADGTLTRRSAPAAKDGCIAWDSGPHSSTLCRTARAIGLIKAWTMSPDGKQLYVLGDQQGIAIIDRDTTTGLLSERAVPNGCITETGRSSSSSALGQCRVGGYALRELSDLAVTPDGALLVAGGNFGVNSSDPIPPPRYTLGGVTALSRDASGSLTMTGCYSGTRRSLASEPLTTGECAAARGLDNVPYNVSVTPDGKHVYFGVGPFDTERGSGLALFRVVPNNEPAPGPGVRVDAVDTAVKESDANAIFELELLSPAVRQTTIQYTTFDDTAKAGSDYTARTGTATIAQGATVATVNVPITKDTTPEQPETFGLRITAADGAVLTEPEGTASITDDDGRPPPPAISIGAAEVVEGDGDGAVLRFPLTLTPADAPDISSLSWSVTGGTATAGEDFTRSSGSVTVMPLGTTTIDVPIKGDDVFEGDETVVVRLSDAFAATLGTKDATGTIRDDESAPPTPTPTPTPDPGGGVTPPAALPAPGPSIVPPTTLGTLPAPKPQAAVLGLPASKRCASRRSFRITLKAPRGQKAKSILVLVNNKKVKSLTGKKVTAPVDLRGLPKGKFTVKITMTTVSGKTLTQSRSYKTCVPKRKG
jgi:6-phosphogluconolactonase (cycloisomerase 2 family)